MNVRFSLPSGFRLMAISFYVDQGTP